MDNLIYNLPLIYLEWIDVVGDRNFGWKNEEDTNEFFNRKDNIVRDCGFLYKEDDNFLYLIGRYMPSLETESLTAYRTKIPKKWVLNKQEFIYKPSNDLIENNIDKFTKSVCDFLKNKNDE